MVDWMTRASGTEEAGAPRTDTVPSLTSISAGPAPPTPAATHHRHPVERDAERVRGDLREGGLVPLPLGAGARGHHRAPRGIEPDHGALVGADGCPLDIARDPDAAVDAPGPQLRLLSPERV